VSNEITGSRVFTLRWPQFVVVVNNTIIGTGDNLELTFRHALPKEIEMLESTDRIEMVKREVE
jgi:hypothetical protein